MAVSNLDVAGALEERADALALEGANAYRVRAYRKAARSVEGLEEPVARLEAAGKDLRGIPGLGPGLALTVKAIVEGAPPPVRSAKAAAASAPAAGAGL